MTEYTAILTPKRGFNGRYRVWRGEAADWDEACLRAESDNPDWVVHTCGPSVPGAHL